ncbi:ATP-binding cassette domain-containing protein [Corallincola spongiicola]|uniref:ATP-binding cassette domain-containing protein n=1 Tax=Corallincola spongiicola TaxID=2520508 RepID=A0ABY1WQA1_9GAMM|nr:ATP-binding cassette domain-containing protein [Corallincola spongiicola]TAA46898.1 ATP-binding cassette domain-containing protein [Corallincola spongiicola]
MIQLNQVELRQGAKLLLENASFTLFPGHKVGLVGANGCGKSSLLQLLRGEISVDAGDIQVPAQWRIVSVKQETPALQKPAIEYVLDGHVEYRRLCDALAAAEAHAEDGHALAELHSAFETINGYQLPAEAARLMSGLGFEEAQLQKPVSDFSGGWRMRLNLAQALLMPSDALLLDEPTNHLDLDAVIWFERWLQRYPGSVILISHDRDFLDATIGGILSIAHGELTQYTGNYSSFERQRAEQQLQKQIAFDRQQQKRAELQGFINRFKAKASKAKQAQSRIKVLEKMEDLLPAHQASPFSFQFPPPPHMPNPLMSLDRTDIGYNNTPLLTNVNLMLLPGSRLGLLGHNGAGKSTLIKLMAGKLAPLSGGIVINQGVRLGYFAQHQLEALDSHASPLLHLQRLAPKEREQVLRDFLGRFGFIGDQALAPVAPFSGGEKARLALAILVWQAPNLLLLDEPTNHLDLEMRHALTMALQAFEGAIVIVSHDRHLLKSCCDEFVLVDSQQVTDFSGDLDEYQQWLLSSNKVASDLDGTDGSSETAPVKIDRKAQKRLEAEFRQQTKATRKRIENLEKLMEKGTDSLATIEQRLAEPSLYEAENKAELNQLLLQQAEYKQTLEQSEAEWLELQEQLEEETEQFREQLDGTGSR